MALSPRTVRTDLKCGKGAISKGEKCTKGGAREVLEKVAPIALGLGLAAGAIALRQRARANRTSSRRVPEIPKQAPKPPQSVINNIRKPASTGQGMVERVIQNNRKRIQENPEEVRRQMQTSSPNAAYKAHEEMLKNLGKRKSSSQPSTSENTSTLEELGKAASDPHAFRELMGGKPRKPPRGFGRTDSFIIYDSSDSLRLDLKCGKGSISKGEKCHKGTATTTKENNTVRNIALAAGAAAVVGGALYGRRSYNRAKQISQSLKGTRPTPEQQISVGKKAFKEAEGMGIGTQIAGAGLTTAGVALTAGELSKKDPKKRNQAAVMGGLGLAYLGLGTVNAGRMMRRSISEKGAEWSLEAEQYKNQYYNARNAAQERARQQEASGSYGSRNVGTNKAVEDPFKDIGVPESASDAEVKAAWLKLMRKHHPDVGGDPRKAQQVNAAYQEIMRRRGKLDSIYADGFNIDWESLTS